MPNLIRIPFHGDELWAVEKDGRPFVAVKRVCEMLGVDVESQRKKLKDCGWAVTAMITATGPDGKTYEMTAVDLDSFPQWMVTIHASKVSEQARPMLLRLQREAKRVLADHFFKRKPETELAGAVVMRLLDAITETQRQNGVILERLTALEARPIAAIGHTITAAEADSIRARKKRIAHLMVELGDSVKLRAAHAIIWEGVQRAADWYGKCATIGTMPTRTFGNVDRFLREKLADLERRRDLRSPRQTELFPRPGLVRLASVEGAKP